MSLRRPIPKHSCGTGFKYIELIHIFTYMIKVTIRAFAWGKFVTII